MSVQLKRNDGPLIDGATGLTTKDAVMGAIKAGISLYNAGLYNAGLCNADLYNADLRNANLRNADLRNANLRNANLRNAGLCNANLRNAGLVGIRSYADSHDVAMELGRRIAENFSRRAWSAIGQIILQRLCWNEIVKLEGARALFKALDREGYGEYLSKYNSMKEGEGQERRRLLKALTKRTPTAFLPL